MATPEEQAPNATLTKVVRFRANDGEVQRLKTFARSRGLSMSVALRQMIRAAVNG